MNRYLSILASLFLIGFIIIGCTSEELTSAKLYIQQENYEKAEEYLNKAMVVEPANPEIPYLLGEIIYAKQKDWVKMNEMFDLALSLGADTRILDGNSVQEYVEDIRRQNWVDTYNKAVNDYNDFRETSDDTKKQELLEKTINGFETAILVDPEKSENYSILATCYYEHHEPEKAAEIARKGVEINPDDVKLNIAAGQILSNNGDKEGAILYFMKAIELDGGNSVAIRNLAQIYYDLDRIDESIATYEKAIRNETDRLVKADLYFNLGVLYMQINDFYGAEDNFMMAYDMNPDDVEALIGMALTFESAKKFSRAEKFYKELIAIDSENPNHYKGMARVLLLQGKKDEADHYYSKAKKFGG